MPVCWKQFAVGSKSYHLSFANFGLIFWGIRIDIAGLLYGVCHYPGSPGIIGYTTNALAGQERYGIPVLQIVHAV